MRKGIIKIVVLSFVFVITVAVMGLFNHQTEVDLTTEMASATLPMVYLERDGVKINELYGYCQEMDGTAMRDTITPLLEDLSLSVVVQSYQNNIESISYEVRSMDMQRLIENGDIEDFSEVNGEIQLRLQFENILELDTEYVLVLMVTIDEKPVYFYTRMIREKDYYVEESLDFIMNFHELTFDKGKVGNLATFLEPNSQADNTTLQKVTIHSSLSQVGWGDFEGERLEAPTPSIKELGSAYNSIVLQYVVTAPGDNGELEYYNVEEYYRVRYSCLNSRMFLLNYDRSMNQIFRGENATVVKNRLILGICPSDIQCMTNEKGNVVAFVQEGELWSYNSDGHELSQVFSFRSPEGISKRENNEQHEIQMIRIDEMGSMDFVVYGYMNRGHHEGQTGIGVYHYDSVGNTLEEEMFLASDRSHEMLKEDWGKVFYISGENMFYLMTDGQLYRIDLNSLQEEVVIEDLKVGSYAVSENGRYIAWQEEFDNHSKKLKLMDLEGEDVRTIEGNGEEYLKPVGFVESDFIYGTAKMKDVTLDTAGNTRFPMYKVTIVDKNSKIIKEYEKDGYFVSNAYVEDDTIYLDREIQVGDKLLTADQDTIKNQQLESSRPNLLETIVTEKKQTQVALTLSKRETEVSKGPHVKVPREVVLEEERAVELETLDGEDSYYVYSAGKILMSAASITEAVQCADENMAVVIGSGQKYIWRRGRNASQSMIGAGALEESEINSNSVAGCLSYLLKTEELSIDVGDLLNRGKTPKEILTEALSDKTVIDLSGCSVNQILYYVGLGNPVFAMVGEQAVLIVGYDQHNTMLYQPGENAVRKMGLQDSDTLFSGAGNIFLGYIE